MKDAFLNLYDTILERRDNPAEGSYTCYLFEKGLDKILKKVGVSLKSFTRKNISIQNSLLTLHFGI